MASRSCASLARQWVTTACLGLLAAASAALAEPEPCTGPTISAVHLPTTLPSSCVAVQTQHADIVLDASRVEAHASGTTTARPDDPHVARLDAERALALLQAATAGTGRTACARRVIVTDWADWLFYVSLQIDQGQAVVYATGSSAPAPTVLVRDRPLPCKPAIGGTSTRAYGLPGGRWFLALITGVS